MNELYFTFVDVASFGLSIGEHVLVFYNAIDIPSHQFYASMATPDFRALSCNDLRILDHISQGFAPIGFGIVIRAGIPTTVMFTRFPKLKNDMDNDYD